MITKAEERCSCDRCGERIRTGVGRSHTVVLVRSEGINGVGENCRSAGDSFDLCRSCSVIVEEFLRAEVEHA